MRAPLIGLSDGSPTVLAGMNGTSEAPAVVAQALRKAYGRIVAVDDLSFEVRPAEILGVLGPNGAGKTTAIRVLTTILEPTRGAFRVAGIPHTPERQTGQEFLRYHARLFGHSTASARATASTLLAEVGLADRGNSLLAGYSRGMRQRLGIARALVNAPEVVFLDEPTLGLDPAGQHQVLALVRRITAERGATVLLSTHLLSEVEEICSHVLILHKGRVAAAGTVSDIARRAAAPRSARLRVSAERVHDAIRVLGQAPGIERVVRAEGQPGSLTALLDGGTSNGLMNEGLSALAGAGVPVFAFELEGARLSDAFLSMTEGG